MLFSKPVQFAARNFLLEHQRQSVAPTVAMKNASTVHLSSVAPIAIVSFIVVEIVKERTGNMAATRQSVPGQRLSGSRLHLTNH